jgi:hypothetical protein
MKHTPGPWTVGTSDDHWKREVRGESGKAVAFSGCFPIAEAHANAKLISAAPELLEALKDVMHLIDIGWLVRDITNDDQPGFAMRQLKPLQTLAKANEAIAKAES